MAGIEDLYPQFQEFARRSARNLGGAVDWLAGGAQAGAEPALALMRGDDIDQPLFPTPESGGKSRLGAVASGLNAHLFPGAAPAGALGTYVGAKAAQVPQRYREFAEKAAQRGMDNEAIRQKYGWFQDPAGDWKFEISDHAARIVQDKDGNWKLIHPELRRQYPDMVDTLKIEPIPGTDRLGRGTNLLGQFSHEKNTAYLNEDVLNRPLALAGQDYEPLRILLHELQHGIQRHEGHSPGTNPHSSQIGQLEDTEYWPKRADLGDAIEKIRDERTTWFNDPANHERTLDDYDQLFPDWRQRHDDAIRAWAEYPDVADWKMRKYNTALGEVEARDTMHRQHLTPDQRKAQPPYAGEGVPFQEIWDIREVQPPRKAAAADVPEGPEMRTVPVTMPDGVRIPVHSGATKAQAADLLSKSYYGHMRGLIDPDTGQVHLWEAGAATHDQMAQQLGLDWQKIIASNGRLNITNPGQLDYLDAFKGGGSDVQSLIKRHLGLLPPE